MAHACLMEQAQGLRDLGRYEDAEAAYQECMRQAEQFENQGGMAVCQMQLGTVWFEQRRYCDALGVR